MVYSFGSLVLRSKMVFIHVKFPKYTTIYGSCVQSTDCFLYTAYSLCDKKFSSPVRNYRRQLPTAVIKHGIPFYDSKQWNVVPATSPTVTSELNKRLPIHVYSDCYSSRCKLYHWYNFKISIVLFPLTRLSMPPLYYSHSQDISLMHCSVATVASLHSTGDAKKLATSTLVQF